MAIGCSFRGQQASTTQPCRFPTAFLWLDDRIARVIITVEDDTMVLLHGFIKKAEKIRRKICNLPDNACGPYMRYYERAAFG